MSLFKVFAGTANEFPQDYELHPGYAYFFEDSNELVMDTPNGRYDVKASVLTRNNDDIEFVDVDDVLITENSVALTEGCVLVAGEKPNTVKVVAAPAEGGALYSDGLNAPSFGTLPIEQGGTGATTAAAARTNLDVYSKTEVDTKVNTASALAYQTVLTSAGWVQSGSVYTNTYANSAIRCGKNGNVPPIITCTDGIEDYYKVTGAAATPGEGIVFTASAKPTGDIYVTITDMG